jgi:hypothetical protein
MGDDVLGKPCGTLHSFPFSIINYGPKNVLGNLEA